MSHPATWAAASCIRHTRWLMGRLDRLKKPDLWLDRQTRHGKVAQIGHHLFVGTYLAYLSSPRIGPQGLSAGAMGQGSTWRCARRWLGDLVRHPGAACSQGSTPQSIGIIQAPDMLPDGRADMCDSCPDITIYDGKFVNSCRMDEYRLFGGYISVAQKEEAGTIGARDDRGRDYRR